MPRAQLLTGDALTVLRTLPSGSVRCCITSPPYWGLRDYGTAQWEGGEAGCSHVERTMKPSANSTLERHGLDGRSPQLDQLPGIPFRHECGKCGARRIDAQLGLERTPEEYVARLVEVFREVRRVLADDGTLWLNLGDSYASQGGSGRQGASGQRADRRFTLERDGGTTPPPGLKPKDLVGIPWSVAFALRADGWYLRSEIIWAKPNPMPESVTDRPTKAHEQIFLLSKRASYFYDAAAIAEPVNTEYLKARWGGSLERTGANGLDTIARSLPTGKSASLGIGANATRNARTVWEIATQPYAGAHFATFPEELARRCILAGSAPGDTVLDPFSGSGTVASVAVGNGRAAIGIELNPKYQELALHRIGPLLASVEAA